MGEGSGRPWSELVRPGVRELEAYGVPHPADIEVKLDANEHPYPLPRELRAELARELAEVELHRYPEIDAGELRRVIAAEHALAPDALVFGNGSDELIHLLCATFAAPRAGSPAAVVLFPVPTFSVFRIAALANGCEPAAVPLARDFAADPEALAREVRARRPNLVFLARPNNPTGTDWPVPVIADLAARHPDVLFVSDEAYGDYGTESALGAAAHAENLLVLRTLSKIGLAALRIGYLAAVPALCREVDKVRGPYNVGSLNQRAATWLLRRHRELLRRDCEEVMRARERMAAALRALPGIEVFPSAANFLLVRVAEAGDGRATGLWQRLSARGILVRCFDAPGPLVGCLRITIGTASENERLLSAITELVG